MRKIGIRQYEKVSFPSGLYGNTSRKEQRENNRYTKLLISHRKMGREQFTLGKHFHLFSQRMTDRKPPLWRRWIKEASEEKEKK